VAFEVFAKGEYFFKANHDSPVIFDCGANIGLATLFFKRLYPKARVHSFEADPATSEILRFNVERNHLQNVVVRNVLLADHAGTEKFHVAARTPGSLMMSSVAARFGSDDREITVNAERLSEYIDGPVDLLKLDVEGSEFGVMRELVSSGKIAQIARMIIEYHHRIGNQPSRLASFLQLLEDAGFEYYIDARFNWVDRESDFQDILIGAYRV
jgi:FkbM family methyltransferase